MAKKMLLVLSRNIYSLDGGREVLLADFIRRMAVGFEIDILYFDNKKHVPPTAEYGRVRGVLSRPGGLSVALNFLKGSSFQDAIFFSNKSFCLLKNILAYERYDVVYFDMVRLITYAKKIRSLGSFSIFFDLDDLLSVRYDLLLKSKIKSGLLGSYTGYFKAFSKFINVGFLQKIILLIERKRVFRDEISVGSFANVVLLTSPAEQIIYSSYSPSANVFSNFPIVPMKSEVIKEEARVDRFALVWVGNNCTAHNLSALQQLICLKNNYLKDIPLSVFGKIPKDFTIPLGEDIVYEGFAPSLNSVFVPGRILLAPFVFGTGIKIKILEAISFDIPVVTNSVGFQGIPYESNAFFLPTNSHEEMASSVRKLIQDAVFRESWLAEQRRVLLTHFSDSFKHTDALAALT